MTLPAMLFLALAIMGPGDARAQSCPGPGTFSSMTFSPADPAMNVNHSISNITMTPALTMGYEYKFQLNGVGAFVTGSSISNVPTGPHCITSAVFASTNVFCNGVLYTAGTEIPNTRSSACLYFGTGAPQPVLASNIAGNLECSGLITPTPAPNRTCFTYEYSVDGGAWTSTLPISVSAGCHTLANRVSCTSGVSFGAPIPTTASATTDFSIFDDLSKIDADDITLVKTCSSGSDGAITSITGLPTAGTGLTYEYSVDGSMFSATLPTNLAPGCHNIIIRQAAECPNSSGDGSTPAMCRKELNFVIYPSAPTITAPSNTCGVMFTLPTVTPIGGFSVEYSIDNGVTWDAAPSTTTPGCYPVQARYVTSGDCGVDPPLNVVPGGSFASECSAASNTVNVLIFPEAPMLTAPDNTCAAAFTLPTVTPVTDFNVQYSVNGGAWSAAPTVPSTPGCHSVKARYVYPGVCGGVARGASGAEAADVVGPAPCDESAAVNVVIFPSAPTLTAPANTCNAALTLPTVTAVTGFNVEWSIDGGTYSASATAPSTAGCHSFQARYVLAAACGSTAAGATAPAACEESNEVSAVVFPAAPSITDPADACNAMFTLPTVTDVAGFDVVYRLDGGNWEANPSTTTTAGCYTIEAAYALSEDCGSTLAGTVGEFPNVESIAQTQVNFFLASFSQSDLAQSFTATDSKVSGASIYLANSTAGSVTIQLYSDLPNMGGIELAQGTASYMGSNLWVDVSWPEVSVTPGSVYYLVLTGTVGANIQGSGDVYPGGQVYANAPYTPYPQFDFGFKVFSEFGGGCGASTSESVVIFPAKPVLTATSNVCAGTAFTLPTVTPVTGFTVEYSINSGAWAASPTVPITAGCHSVQARYVTASACGGTAAGTAGTGDCGASDAVSITTFPSVPTLSAPADVCEGTAVTEPTVTPVTGFSVEFSVDGGTYGSWATVAPTSVGCHSIKARYVLTSDCGLTTAGTGGPTGCVESTEVNVLIFPEAPTLTAPDNTCGTMFTLPTVDPVTDFGVEYSIDNGATWSASPSTTTPGCYSVKARYVYTGTCGTAPTPMRNGAEAPTAVVGPAPCDESAAVNVVIFPDISTENITTVTKSSVCGTTNITAVNWATATPSVAGFELRYDIDGGTAFTNTTGAFTNVAPGCHTVTAKWAYTSACGTITAGALAPDACEETHDFIVWVDMSGNWPTVTLSDTCGAGVKITSVNYLPTAPSIPDGQELVYSGESNGVAFTNLTLDALKMVDFSYNATAVQPGCHFIRAKARATSDCKDSDDATAAADGAATGDLAANTCRTTLRGFITFPAAPTLTADPVCEGGTLTVTAGSTAPTDYAWRYLLVDYTSGTPTPVGSWTANPTFTPATAGCYKVFVTPVRVTTTCNGITIPACGAIYPSNVQRPLDMQNNCNPDGADISVACFDSVDVVVLTQSPMAIQPNNITVCLDETGYIDLAHVQQTVPACVADVANLSYIITSSDELVVTSVPAPGLMSGDENAPELFYTGVNGNNYPNVVTVGVQAVLSVPGAEVSCIGPEVFFTITVQPNFETTTGWNVDPSTAVQCASNDGWTIYSTAGPAPTIVKNDADQSVGGSVPGCTYELYYGSSLSPLGLPVGNALVQSVLGDGNPIEFQKVFIPGTYQVWQRCGGCAELAYTVNLEIIGAPVLTNLQLEACPDAPGGNTATFSGITYPTPAPTTPPSTLTILGYYGTYSGAADAVAGDLISATGGFDHISSDDEIYVRIGQDVDGIPGDDCFHVGVIELRVVNRPVVILTAPAVACVDQTVRVSSNVHSGSGSYQYLWSDGSTTSYIDVTASTPGPVTYTVTVTDPNNGVNGANGPSCTTTESIEVTFTAPALTCPADVTVSADPGTCNAYVNLLPATLNSDCANGTTIGYYATGATTVNSSATPGTLGSVVAVPFEKGVTSVNAVVIGTPSITCSYNVTIVDTEAPIAQCKSIVLALDANGEASVSASQLDGGSSDNCTAAVGIGFFGFENYFETGNWAFSSTGDGSIDVTNAPNSIELTGNDNGVAGNTQLCITAPEALTVVFNWNFQTTDGPLFDPFGYSIDGVFTQLTNNSGPQTQTGVVTLPILAGQSFCFVVNSLDGIFGPGVTIASQFSYNVSFFDCSDLGNNDVELTVTDGSGNTSSCIANVVIQDVTAPSLVCPSSLTQNVAPSTGCTWTSGSLAPVTATDNCTLPGGSLTYEVMNPSQVLSNGAGEVNALVFDKGTSVVEYTLVDGSGNVSTCAFNVTVVDNIAPVFADCPANITVSIGATGTTVSPAGAAGGYVVTDPVSGAGCAVNISYTAPTASDNCTMYVTSLAQGFGAAEHT
ncbi:MAG: hypothetical protein ACK5SQ_00470, partial [Chitinophagales bacterium]